MQIYRVTKQNSFCLLYDKLNVSTANSMFYCHSIAWATNTEIFNANKVYFNLDLMTLALMHENGG